MYCPNCGRRIAPAQFCIYCGKKLPDAAPKPVGSPAHETPAARRPKSSRRVAAPVLSAVVVSAAACAVALLAFPGLCKARPDMAAILHNLHRPGGQA